MPRSPITKPIIITQRFGARPNVYGPKGHPGIDIRSRMDESWMTCIPGVVHFSGYWPYKVGYGAAVELDWGQKDGYIKFIYGHGKNRKKQYVNKHIPEGVQVAVSGNTGFSDSAHLHFEMRYYKFGKKGYIILDPQREFLDKYKIPYKLI